MESIYVGHSRSFNYKEELYKPLRKSVLNVQYNIVIPHEYSNEPFNSKDFLRRCEYMIAEVSFPTTGLGIEMGWADMNQVKIICIYRKGIKVSGSIKCVANIFIEYENEKDLINKLEKIMI